MALNKSNLNVNFSQGLDTKSDPFQVPVGRFLSLNNSIFDKAGQLTKRNGFAPLTALPSDKSRFLTTFNGDLTAVGTSLDSYSPSNQKWTTKGMIKPVSLSTLPIIRNTVNQTQADSAQAPNGFVCTVFTDQEPSGMSTAVFYKYVITDSTGQNILAPTLISVTSPPNTSPRVYVQGNYFIIVFSTLTGGERLKYLAISTADPTISLPEADLVTSYDSTPGLSFDCVVVNNYLYVAYNTSSGGQSVKITYMTNTFIIASPITFAGEQADLMSLTADISIPTAPILWASWFDSGAGEVVTAAVDKSLNPVLAPTSIALPDVVNITASAQTGFISILCEIDNNYNYDTAIPSHYMNKLICTQGGTIIDAGVLIRSVGLASKSFIVHEVQYFLGIYNSDFQPTYFLIDGDAKIISKLSYSNGPNFYYTTGLPNVSVIDEVAMIPYLIKDTVQAVNKSQGNLSPTGVYSQLGINTALFDLNDITLKSVEIGRNLNITGGFLSMYDGYNVVESNFFLWPDNVELTGSTMGGTMTAQQYFYQVTYEWSDNQGNMFRSAPSIPVSVTTTGSTSSVTVHVPTLRLTYKTANPVKIVIYRWSTGQQIYYQVTSINVPVLNDTSVDSIDYVDTLPDSAIIGNNIIYTTGGVLEDIAPPSTDLITLFNNRLWLVDAEDRNLLWYSKQVINDTPVEMSDLLTLYIAPTTGAQGSTGVISAMSPMDDKLIIFKPNAIGYVNGTGPDNTGANSQYSDFVLVNSVVGCDNQYSIVLMPQGLMFQSNKGIWLLGRDLSTQYIGAPVEGLTTGARVLSAINVPATNQVRFTLDTGITLMYDYFYGQWGTFTNIPAISSTIFQSLHTYVNQLGQVFQESPGLYLDNTNPVLLSFTTNWMNLAGVQGYERFYHMFLLGKYLSPFKLNVQLAYDYNESNQQATIVTPMTPGANYGGNPVWGAGSPWGGPSKVFESRVFPMIQKCESFQISINEIYDSSLGIAPGAGLTLSGLNLIVGVKKGYRTSSAARSFG